MAASSDVGREQKRSHRKVLSFFEDIFEPLCTREPLMDIQQWHDITKIIPLHPVYTFKASDFCIVFSKGCSRHGHVRSVSPSRTHTVPLCIVSPVWRELANTFSFWLKMWTGSITVCGQDCLHFKQKNNGPSWFNTAAHQKKRSKIVVKMLTLNYRAEQVLFSPSLGLAFRPISLLQMSKHLF